MTGRLKHPRRASTKASHAAARDSEDEGGEEERETDEQAAPKRRDKGKGRATEVFDSSDEEEEEVETSEDDARDWEESRKKPKKSKLAGKKGGKGGVASVKGKGGRKGKDVGRLEVMKTLPLELLVEIFAHLDPNDLLALSMVNKQYHSLLTSPGSVKIWKNSRKKIDLPDLGTDEITEWQYAQLVFGRECQKCGAKNVKKLDVYLRKRLCKSCSVKDVVKLSSLDRCYPTLKSKLHPRAADCVRKTPYAEPWLAPRFWFSNNAGFVSIDDLHTLSGILRRLEEQDEDESIAEGRSSPAPEARVRKPGSSKRKKPVAGTSSKTWRAIDDDEKDEKDWESARVVNYVAARSASFNKFRQVTTAIAKAAHVAAKYLDAKPRYNITPWWEKLEAYEYPRETRCKQIANRVASLGYTRREVDCLTGKVVTSSADLTDAEWKKIKSKVLKSLERARTTAKEAQLRWPRVDAQQSLKPYYTALTTSLAPAEQPFVPLFIDFLLLPSVKELWMTGDNVSSGGWMNQLNAIKADLEEYRLDLLLHARELILNATTERSEEDSVLEGVDEDMDDFDNNFFDRASSMVCCGFPGCPPVSVARHTRHIKWIRGQPDITYTSEPTLKDRQGSFGTVIDVLKHMHADHNEEEYVYVKHKWKKAPQFHLALPLEVACTVSALLDVHDLDPATAAKEDLVTASKGSWYQWENAPRTKRNFTGKSAWFDLVCAVKRKGEKLGKLKPPVALDPPCIVMRRRGGGDNA